MMPLRFSTKDVPVGQRRAAAEAVYGAHVSGRLEFPDDGRIAVEMSARAVGGIHLAAIATSPVRASHEVEDDDTVYLGIATSGAGALDERGNRVRRGHLNVARRDRPTTTLVTDPSSILSIAIPRALLLPRLAGFDDLVGRAVAPTPASRLLESYVAALIGEERDIPAGHAAILSGHIVDLTCLALGAGGDSADRARGGMRAGRLRAIRADMAASIREPELSPAWLARRHGISESYIRALFYDTGTSFTDHLLSIRLDYVRRMLADSRFDERTIAALALEAGFGDISWFNQVFRRRFDMTPSEMRRAGRQSSIPEP